jgi:hypothetical protein
MYHAIVKRMGITYLTPVGEGKERKQSCAARPAFLIRKLSRMP